MVWLCRCGRRRAAQRFEPHAVVVVVGPAGRAIAALVGAHSTAKAAVAAGVDRKEIVKVAMEDGDVMAWLLATIPEYAKEKNFRAAPPPPRRSLASLSRVCAPLPPLTPCARTHAIRVFCAHRSW